MSDNNLAEANSGKVYKWSEAEADKLAEKYFSTDPLRKKVPPSLLSATDIVAYVEETAMICPFYANNKKLKHASYEACLGDAAYIFDGGPLRSIEFEKSGFLKIPKNEIVFAEVDVFFRLPRYIAARFNLQIKHVHRGLLLGTGPLVDPGFRGRLLVPLHNLTSEDYYIHKSEGLIWFEFTRTTFDESRPEPYGEYPDYKKISDSKQWLHKAAYDKFLKRQVVIRSSIRPMIGGVEKIAKKARRTANKVAATAYVGALALLLTFGLIMLGEIYTNRNFMQSAYNSAISDRNTTDGVLDGVHQDVKALTIEIQELQRKAAQQFESLRAEIEALKSESARANPGTGTTEDE